MSPTHFWFKNHFYSRENTIIGRQRLVLFEVVAIMSIILTISSFFLHPKSGLLLAIDIFTLVITIVLLLLYDTHRLSIRWSATALYVLLQIELSMQKIFCATQQTPETAGLILQASFLSLLLVTVSIVSFLKYSPTIISGLSIITFVFCLFIFPSPILKTFSPVYLVVLVGFIVYDLTASRPLLDMGKGERSMNDEFLEFMHATGLTEDDIRSVTKLSRNNADMTEKTRNLLSLMNSRARNNIVESVISLKAESESTREILMEAFPMLTPSQITICQLILQDKKLSEICASLGKNESNISSQRSRIRMALELNPEDNLKEALEGRVQLHLLRNGRAAS